MSAFDRNLNQDHDEMKQGIMRIRRSARTAALVLVLGLGFAGGFFAIFFLMIRRPP